ncbi:MAG TPA: hypothetical protein VFR73_18190 [Hyphomicrobiaceae bacterium]|nr:hypothetical protein [Hyphomicrobiaceae bacterium]
MRTAPVVTFVVIAACVVIADHARAGPLAAPVVAIRGAIVGERAAAPVDPAQYRYFEDDRYYDRSYRRRLYPPSIYDTPPRYYERGVYPYYSPRAYAPDYVDEPARPTSCGQYRYWNGEYCADARFERPYLGPKW